MNALKIYIQNNFKTIRLTLVVLLLCFGFSFKSTAQQILESPLSKNAFVSLLTVSPGNEVYAQYGHTAIRVCDPDKKLDIAFNYGLFDFRSPNFIWRFVKGQTDYMVGAYSNSEFLLEYLKENRAITEQVINLNVAEKEAVWQALVKNIQPENRTYRYNFIYNNCSTKPRDIIIQSLSGKVDYRWEGKFRSLRDEIHFFTEKFPWTQFGIDFVIGVKADYPANLNGQQFAPDLLRESFSKAIKVNDSGQIRPLVLKTEQLISIDKTQIEKPSWYPGPMIVMWFVFIIVAILSILEIRNNKKYHMLNAVIFTVIGLIGILIAFPSILQRMSIIIFFGCILFICYLPLA